MIHIDMRPHWDADTWYTRNRKEVLVFLLTSRNLEVTSRGLKEWNSTMHVGIPNSIMQLETTQSYEDMQLILVKQTYNLSQLRNNNRNQRSYNRRGFNTLIPELWCSTECFLQTYVVLKPTNTIWWHTRIIFINSTTITMIWDQMSRSSNQAVLYYTSHSLLMWPSSLKM